MRPLVAAAPDGQGLLHGTDGLAQNERGFGSGELGGMGHFRLLI